MRKYKKFFRGFRFLKYKKFSRGGFFLFLGHGLKNAGFHFRKYKNFFLLRKYKKSFFLRKYKNFFNIRARTFYFRKYKEFFSRWIVFILVGGGGLGPGSALSSCIMCYCEQLSQATTADYCYQKSFDVLHL